MTAPDQTNAEVSDERLREIIEGCEGVTLGPWAYEQAGPGMADMRLYSDLGGEHRHSVVVALIAPQKHDNDAKHIARLDPATVKALATELLTRRSVTSQASEGEVSGEVSLIDAQPPEQIGKRLHEYVEARLAVRNSRKQTYLAAEERVRAAYAALRDEFASPASPSKRVERLETALKDAEAELFEAEDKFWVAHCNYPSTTKPSFAAERQGQDKAFLATMSDRMKAARERAAQALQGGRS